MRGIGLAAILTVLVPAFAQEPEGLLGKAKEAIRAALERLPDYTCLQTVERYNRFSSEKPWERNDVLRLEVGLVNNREIYSWKGAEGFEERTLADLVGRGTVGTGHFGLLAKHVFDGDAAAFTYKGEEDRDGRRLHHYSFDVPLEKSSYRLRAGNVEAITAFQGEAWVDAATLGLVQLEVQAYDVDDKLGVAQADHNIQYKAVRLADADYHLPDRAEMLLVASDGHESMNRIQMSECRQFLAESKIAFLGAETSEAQPTRRTGSELVPTRAVVELALREPIAVEKAVVGDAIMAVVARPVKEGERVILPEGVPVHGRLVRLEKQTIPYELYEVGIEFHAMELGGQMIPFIATMVDAGPASGLLRQQKTFMPTFTRKRINRMDVLVREKQEGQGVLLWQARREAIPKGLKMRWRIE